MAYSILRSRYNQTLTRNINRALQISRETGFILPVRTDCCRSGLQRINLQRSTIRRYGCLSTQWKGRWGYGLDTTVTTQQAREYAKGKDKGGKSKKERAKSHIPAASKDQLEMVFKYTKMIEHMEATVEHLKLDYIKHLSLRTSQGLLDEVIAETPDGQFPLIEIAQITQKNPQLVVINMATNPQYIAAVKKAIMLSGMNLNPQQDKTSLFVPIPKVTREHREQMAKNAKTLYNDTKTKLNHVEGKFLRDVKKVEKSHPEDLIRDVKAIIVQKTQEYSHLAEEFMKTKQKELLGEK